MATEAKIQYEVVVGMEVHAQLKTNSKIFCGCSARFGAESNTQTCPVCLGMPGVLPVLNKKVVEMAIAVGLATHCRIAPYSRFARKNYFYPDLPKGYQISQYELPLCEGGHIEIAVGGRIKRIGLRRIHLEEDAGKNLHEGRATSSHVDLNRAGVPLIEIVSEPEIHSAEEAVAYLRILRDILIYLGVCDGNMEEGSFRCEPNISLRPIGQKTFGTRVEVKNINSFRFVQKAIEYELKRQEEILRDGGEITQETCLWNAADGVTVTMRSKEEAHDYRYFPEPDLVPLAIPEEWIEEIKRGLPELRSNKKERFVRDYRLPEYDAGLLTASRASADYFEQCVSRYSQGSTIPITEQAKTISNWMMTDLFRDSPVTPDDLAGLQRLVDRGVISRNIAKDIIPEMSRTKRNAEAIVKEKGLTQVSDVAALETIIAQVIEDNPREVVAYRQGKEKLLGFFVGQVMKASKGKAHPGKVNEILKKKLEKEGK